MRLLTMNSKTRSSAVIAKLLWVVAIGLLFVPTSVWAQSETVVYYHTDAIGSVRATSDENGDVIERFDYLPFVELCEAACNASPTPDVRQFAGKERDTQTGLDYFGARYFRASSGRFTTVDPVLNIGAALTDPQRWNRYAYSKNNPLAFIDPDGRELFRVVGPYERAWYQWAGAVRDGVANALGADSPGSQNPFAVAGREIVDSLLATVLYRNSMEAAYASAGAVAGMAFENGGLPRLKPVNLPAWRTVGVEMGEVISGHTSGGSRAIQSGRKSLFPDSMGPEQIENAIRNAYRYGKKVATQGDRVKIQGPWGKETIEMYLNLKTKKIETAYPLQ